MSAFLKAPFAEVAPYLHDFGFHPVPIPPGKKGPLVGGWQTPQPPDHYLPYRNPENGWVKDCSRCGTGILAAACPAPDIDIRDREIVRVMIALADDLLGPAPFRIGSPPKALLLYSTAVPFEKLTSRWWALPGENWRAPGYSPHRIEILGDGQQFVAYARHPRGTFYRWRRGEPMAMHRVDLPEIDHAAAKGFLAAAEAVLEEVGAVPLHKVAGQWTPLLVRPEASPRPTSKRYGALTVDRSWQRLEPEELARRLDPKHARRTRSGWICSCPAHTSEGHRSLSILPRDDGGSNVHCFAECSFPDIAGAIARIVGNG